MQYDLENTDVSLELFGSDNSKLIDERITKNKETPFLLMLRASTSAKDFLVNKKARSITIFIGKGNNGEDGLCLAALLKIENIKTNVVDLSHNNRPKTHAYKFCLNLGINIHKFNAYKIPNADWYVDANAPVTIPSIEYSFFAFLIKKIKSSNSSS